MTQKAAHIHVGIGGWRFDGWRGGAFYPSGLRAADELAWASQRLTGMEINSTYYATQKPATFARWRQETPDGFVFALKASRFATQRRVLGEADEAIARFVESGITELGDKLGPIVWQLMPGMVFNADDLEHFFALLPDAINGHALRHVLEPRHASFACAQYLALARDYRVATVATDSPDYPNIFDPTAGFIYARLMGSAEREPAGYPPAELDRWATRARIWREGRLPPGLPLIDPLASSALAHTPRDVFIQFISGAKARNPAAAMGMIERLRAA